MPAATSPVCTIAVTDPLPLVPATWIDVNCCSGWPSAAQRRVMFSSPSLIPEVSSAYSRSSKPLGVPLGVGGGRARRDERRQLDGRRLRAHEPQRARDRRFHVAPIDDQV